MVKSILATAVLTVIMSTAMYAQDRAGRKPPSPEKVVAHLDTDKDGKISKAEADAAERGKLSEHFDDVDSNADGYVDAAELKTAFEKRRKHKGGRK